MVNDQTQTDLKRRCTNHSQMADLWNHSPQMHLVAQTIASKLTNRTDRCDFENAFFAVVKARSEQN